MSGDWNGYRPALAVYKVHCLIYIMIHSLIVLVGKTHWEG